MEPIYFARKPINVPDIKEQITAEITPGKMATMMVGPKREIIKECKNWKQFYRMNLAGHQFWRVKLLEEDVEVFVDTQGYDYPRYVGIIEKEINRRKK